MGVKLGLTQSARNIGWGCLGIVLRKIFGPMIDLVMGSGEEDIMRHFMICTHQIFGSSNQEK